MRFDLILERVPFRMKSESPDDLFSAGIRKGIVAIHLTKKGGLDGFPVIGRATLVAENCP